MPVLSVTSVCAAVFAIMIAALSLQVSLRRVKLGGIDFGDGDDTTLRRRIRAHGNFIEYAPLAVVCVGLLEIQKAPENLVLGIAFSFVLTRIVHAAGMLLASTPTLRAIAMMIQHVTFLTVAGSLLYLQHGR